jgi:peptide deformylase
MLELVKFPNPILREVIPEFDFSNPSEDPKQLEKDMLELMYSMEGIGLAATQVGKRVRMFVIGNAAEPEKGEAFFNPQVIANTKDLDDLEEGCLSFPGIYVKIKRPKAIKARWQNSAGEWQESEFNGYDCKCFLHELDHLEGITYQDRVSTLKWALAVKKTKKRAINVRTK